MDSVSIILAADYRVLFVINTSHTFGFTQMFKFSNFQIRGFVSKETKALRRWGGGGGGNEYKEVSSANRQSKFTPTKDSAFESLYGDQITIVITSILKSLVILGI